MIFHKILVLLALLFFQVPPALFAVELMPTSSANVIGQNTLNKGQQAQASQGLLDTCLPQAIQYFPVESLQAYCTYSYNLFISVVNKSSVKDISLPGCRIEAETIVTKDGEYIITGTHFIGDSDKILFKTKMDHLNYSTKLCRDQVISIYNDEGEIIGFKSPGSAFDQEIIESL